MSFVCKGWNSDWRWKTISSFDVSLKLRQCKLKVKSNILAYFVKLLELTAISICPYDSSSGDVILAILLKVLTLAAICYKTLSGSF